MKLFQKGKGKIHACRVHESGGYQTSRYGVGTVHVPSYDTYSSLCLRVSPKAEIDWGRGDIVFPDTSVLFDGTGADVTCISCLKALGLEEKKENKFVYALRHKPTGLYLKEDKWVRCQEPFKELASAKLFKTLMGCKKSGMGTFYYDLEGNRVPYKEVRKNRSLYTHKKEFHPDLEVVEISLKAVRTIV